jgi:hypothetical protein
MVSELSWLLGDGGGDDLLYLVGVMVAGGEA